MRKANGEAVMIRLIVFILGGFYVTQALVGVGIGVWAALKYTGVL